MPSNINATAFQLNVECLLIVNKISSNIESHPGTYPNTLHNGCTHTLTGGGSYWKLGGPL